MALKLSKHQYNLLHMIIKSAVLGSLVGLLIGGSSLISFEDGLLVIGLKVFGIVCFMEFIFYLLRKIIIVEDKPRELKNNNEH